MPVVGVEPADGGVYHPDPDVGLDHLGRHGQLTTEPGTLPDHHRVAVDVVHVRVDRIADVEEPVPGVGDHGRHRPTAEAAHRRPIPGEDPLVVGEHPQLVEVVDRQRGALARIEARGVAGHRQPWMNRRRVTMGRLGSSGSWASDPEAYPWSSQPHEPCSWPIAPCRRAHRSVRGQAGGCPPGQQRGSGQFWVTFRHRPRCQ